MKHADTETIAGLLAEGADFFGIPLSDGQLDSFAIYLDLLSSWNRRLNLTSIRDPRQVVRLHFLDAIAVCPFIPVRGKLLDVGTGAGIPGLPVKIVHPDKEVFLVEPRRKRASFLKHVIRSLRLKGITVIEERIEDVSVEDIGAVNETVTRAFGDIDLFLRTSSALLRSGGQCLLMQGPKGPEIFKSIEERLAELNFTASYIKEFSLPSGGERRTLIVCTRA